MTTLHTATTNALSPAVKREIRALLDMAFVASLHENAFTDDDWEHALGGLHVWIVRSGRVVSHGSLVARALTCAGVRLRVGYVEAVATAEAERRRGYGARVMRRIGALIDQGYVLGALSTGTHAFYEGLGWERWRGPTFVDGPRGRLRTPTDDGDIMVRRTPATPPLDLDGTIVCDWRAGDVW